MLGSELTEDDVHELYTWVDSMPLSRPKKSISRDFADGGERRALLPRGRARLPVVLRHQLTLR